MQNPFQLPGSVNTSASPAPVSLNGADNSIFVFYKGVVGDNALYMTRTTDSIGEGEWSQAVALPPSIASSEAPAAVSFKGYLYVVYKSVDPGTSISLVRTDSSMIWFQTPLPASLATSSSPGVVACGDMLYIFYQGSNGNENVFVFGLNPDNALWSQVS